MPLWIIRHGRSALNEAMRAALENRDFSHFTSEFRQRGDAGQPLTQLGIEQARIARKWMDDNGIYPQRAIRSPYLRTQQTQEHMGYDHLPTDIEPLLREQSWGRFCTHPEAYWEELLEYQNRLFSRDPDSRPLEGETRRELHVRVVSWVRKIDHLAFRDEEVVLIGHGGSMSSLKLEMAGQPLESIMNGERRPVLEFVNCQVLAYRTTCPVTGKCAGRLAYSASFSPCKESPSVHDWTPIV